MTTLTPHPSPLVGEGNPAAELLAFLRAAGFTLRSEGDKLLVHPGAKLSPAERGQVVSLKAGLLALLAEERWVQCQMCLRMVDSGCPEDVWRFCGVPICPYRPRGKR